MALTPEQQAAIDRVRGSKSLNPAQLAAIQKVRAQKTEDASPTMQMASFGGAAVPEAMMQMGSAMVAEPLAGLYGIGAALMPGGQSGGDAVRSAREAMTYEPRSEEGRNLLPGLVNTVVENTPGFIKEPISAVSQGYQNLSDSTADKFGPAAGAAMASLPTALAEAVPGGMALRQARRAPSLAPQRFIDEPAAPPAAAAPPADLTTPAPAEYENVAKYMGKSNPEKTASTVAPDEQILKDAEALGIVLNPSAYSTNRAYIDMENALKSRPGSMLNTVEERAIIDLGNRADDLIENLGGSHDKNLVDANVKEEFSKTMTDLNKQSDVLYGKVSEAIPRATRVVPQTTKDFIDAQIAELGGNESLLTSAERNLKRLFREKPDPNNPDATIIEDPTYAALDRVRRDIGSAIGTRSGPFKDDDVGQLRRLYAVLAEDQQKFADAFGVGNEYKDAQALVRQRKLLEDRAVDVFGRDVSGSIIPKLKQAATNLTKGDVSKLTNLMESLPENRRGEVAASMLNDLFTSGARRDAAIGQGFSNAFAGLNRNPTAKAELFKYLPKEAEERFNMIGRVTTGLYRAKALENTSRTARDILAALDNGGMLSKIYDVGKKVAAAEGMSSSVGLPGAGTAGVVGSVLSKGATKATKAADEMLASEGFREAVRQAAAGNSQKAQAMMQETPEYKAWLEAQSPGIKTKIAAIGVIPFLTGSTEE